MSIQRKTPLILTGGLALAGLGTPDFWPVAAEATQVPSVLAGRLAQVAVGTVDFWRVGVEALKPLAARPVGGGGPGNFSRGNVVTIAGLQSRADLNGEKGLLLHFDDKTGRWAVQISSSEEQVKVKTANIERFVIEDGDPQVPELKHMVPKPIGPAEVGGAGEFLPGEVVVIEGLQGRIDLNDQEGCLIEFDVETDRWGVEILSSKKRVSVKTLNLKYFKFRPAAGGSQSDIVHIKVRQQQQESRADLDSEQQRLLDSDGKQGRLLRFDTESEKWKVQILFSGEELLIEPAYLTILTRYSEYSELLDKTITVVDTRNNSSEMRFCGHDSRTDTCWLQRLPELDYYKATASLESIKKDEPTLSLSIHLDLVRIAGGLSTLYPNIGTKLTAAGLQISLEPYKAVPGSYDSNRLRNVWDFVVEEKGATLEEVGRLMGEECLSKPDSHEWGDVADITKRPLQGHLDAHLRHLGMDGQVEQRPIVCHGTALHSCAENGSCLFGARFQAHIWQKNQQFEHQELLAHQDGTFTSCLKSTALVNGERKLQLVNDGSITDIHDVFTMITSWDAKTKADLPPHSYSDTKYPAAESLSHVFLPPIMGQCEQLKMGKSPEFLTYFKAPEIVPSEGNTATVLKLIQKHGLFILRWGTESNGNFQLEGELNVHLAPFGEGIVISHRNDGFTTHGVERQFEGGRLEANCVRLSWVMACHNFAAMGFVAQLAGHVHYLACSVNILKTDALECIAENVEGESEQKRLRNNFLMALRVVLQCTKIWELLDSLANVARFASQILRDDPACIPIVDQFRKAVGKVCVDPEKYLTYFDKAGLDLESFAVTNFLSCVIGSDCIQKIKEFVEQCVGLERKAKTVPEKRVKFEELCNQVKEEFERSHSTSAM